MTKKQHKEIAMARPVIERVWSAFKTYRICAERRERQRDYRGDSFGIAVDHDRFAREWQRWDRRAGVVERWFAEHFANKEEPNDQEA